MRENLGTICRCCGAYTHIRRGYDGTAPPEHMPAQEWHDHARCVEGREPLYVR